jgi:ABC-2 type transport system ATP-binding protein
MNIIEVNNLSKSFGKVEALKGFSFSLPEGHIGGFLGPNGAGKTTTVKILMGLLSKDSGTVKLFGNENYNSVDIRRKIGFVPEEFSLYEYMRGEELLDFNGSLFNGFDRAIIEKLQTIFSLPLKRKISSYSKGMKKLLSLYLAVSTKPELLILDEPTDGLDPVFRERLLNFLVDFVSDHGVTVLFSSHILSEVEKVADLVILIKNGQLVLQSDLDALKENSSRFVVHCTDVKKMPVFAEKYVTVETADKEKGLYSITALNNAAEVAEKLKAANCEIIQEERLLFSEIFMKLMELSGGKDEGAV